MANTIKNTKTEPPIPKVPRQMPELSIERKKQIRLGSGIFFILSGIFICVSIISYYFSWNSDQDKLLSVKTIWEFLFHDNSPVANLGGRLGATLSHILVYKGAGIASLAVGMGIAGIGLNLIYGKKILPILLYMRWISILLLIIAPILSYLFPHTAYPYPLGGALGDVAIDYLNGLLGIAGTGMVLFSCVMFFLFVIIALDITPMITKIRNRAKKMAEALAATQEFNPEPIPATAAQQATPVAEKQPEPKPTPKTEKPIEKPTAPRPPIQPVTPVAPAPQPAEAKKIVPPAPKPEANKLKTQSESFPLIIEDKRNAKEWEMEVVEKPLPPPTAAASAVSYTILPDEENPGQFVADEDYNAANKAPAKPIAQVYQDEEEEPEEDIKEEEEDAPFDHEPEMEPEEEDFDDEEEDFDDDFKDEEDEEDEEVEVVKGNKKEAHQPEFTYVMKEEKISPALKHGAHISIADNTPFAPEETLRNYKYPTLDLLEERQQEKIALNKEELERNKEQIIQTLMSFGIEIKTIKATVGPTVTLYQIVPAEGVRISKIKNLEDDIALNLAALGIRIIAPIYGTGTIGIEVPNANKQIVSMRALLSSEKFVNSKMALPIALGKKIDNENYIVDLATMPHLLMAGATGQGKSVGINAILVSLLYKKHPSQLKFVMIDPKKVELAIYRTIEKHFLAKLPNEEEPVITDIKKVIYTLKALCDEMDDRYGLLKDASVRNIKEYNEKFIARKLNPNEHKFLPYIVLVIDEFADLIMTAGKEVEMPIARLAQLARAVGIHLIIATQRPSVNVITGTIKANFPARIAFKVSAKVDSRTILDQSGAEQLIGRGDLLISFASDVIRLQCAFVDTPEVEKVVEFIGQQQGYPHAHALPEPEMDDEDTGSKTFDKKSKDKLFEDCARVVVQTQSGSTSMLQRRFNLGYNRAGRIMDQLEAAGMVGPASGSKPRDVYYKTESELDQCIEDLE